MENKLGGLTTSSLIATGVDTPFNIGQSLFNHRLAEKSANNQYQRQLDFWNMQNEYNDPLNQRMRLQRAGINPAGVAGDIAQGNTAGDLSSVPGNEYAQNGVLRLEGLAKTLETMARIENLGSETGLNAVKMTTEALQQTLIGLGIDKAEVDYIIAQYEAQSKELELENLPYFYEHTRNMYSLEESYKSAQIDYERAQTALANAQTEESKESANNLVAETGLIALKLETERSIASLNYSRKYQIDWETKKSIVLAPLERRALEIANEVNATEEQRKEIETAMRSLELQAKTNDEGDANLWYYVDEGINAIGKVFGVAIGYAVGSKTK